MAELIGTVRPRMRHRIFAYLAVVCPRADRGAPDVSSGRWRWLFADAAGVVVAGPPVCFTSDQVAENWLLARSLLLQKLGVSAVTLLDGEHAVYGPAPLPGVS